MGSCSMDDLLAQLDATNAWGRQQGKLRQDTGPRIAFVHHLEEPEWKPLPKLDAVRQTLKAGVSRHFVCHTKNNGYAFSEPGYLAPKVLDVWTNERSLQPERNYKYPKIAPPRFHSQSEPLPEPTDDMMAEQHRVWLEKHREQRVHHLYPVAHALDRVEKAQKAYEVHKKMREQATDIITRSPNAGAPGQMKLGAHAKAGLAKAMAGVKATRALNQLSGLEGPEREAEKEDYRNLVKAKSAPVLQHSQQPPEGRLEHLRRFQYTNVASRSSLLRTSTPWQHFDEVQDLKKLGRKTW